MSSAGRLSGLNTVVTGAAGGIGRSIALAFAAEGAAVAALDVDRAGAEATCAAIEQGGATGFAVSADVRDHAAVSRAFDEIAQRFGRLDVLVNNAGVSKSARFEGMSDEHWQRIWQTNLESAIHCTQSALPLLRKADHPKVINMASILAHNYFRKLSAYSASKGALASLSRSLALELARDGICVNYVLPGFIRTSMTERLHSHWLYRKLIERRTPLRRLGEPEDVAKVVLFLASSDANFITGQGITVDGGLTLNAL